MAGTEKDIIVYVRSLGCAKNLVDTEVMCGALSADRCFLTDDVRIANVYLVNTCGFIRDAKTESHECIGEAVKWKRGRHGRMVVVAGCLVHRELDELKKKYPAVDVFMSLDDVPRIATLIREARKSGCMVGPDKISLPTYLYNENEPRLLLTPSSYAYIKVAEGCDHRCAYCAIPMIRGNQRSRTAESVEKELRQLVEGGTKEIDLIAQDTSRYGVDLGRGNNLEALLRRCDAIEGDFWLRVLYTHPLHLTEGLVDVLANSRHVVPYLDIPLQHISTGVLRSMRRGMDGDKVRELLDGIRKVRPDMVIRTTFLVGFPGETDDDFLELLDYVKSFEFDRLGVFAFSPEVGTEAYGMKDGLVPAEVASERLEKIMLAQRDISLAKNKKQVGTTVKLLLDEPISIPKRGKGGVWYARTMGDAPEVDQVVTVNCTRRYDAPCFVEAKISSASHYELVANEIN